MVISHFFDAWNHHDPTVLGQLFTADGVLDMATKHQDTQAGREAATAGGRGMIVSFAKRQWRLGETMSYRGMTILAGGAAGYGGYARRVVARFADGAVQPMNEAKFAFGCSDHAFDHVVITSAKAAAFG